MQISDKRSLRSHPSLLPLRMALIAAEKESPSRPPCTDPDQQRALQLIARMKMEYRKPLLFTLQEVIGSNV